MTGTDQRVASAPAEASSLQHKHVLCKLRLPVYPVEGLITRALLFWWIKPHTKQALIQRWSRKLLAPFRVSPVVHGESVTGPELAGSMLVFNHVPWIDIYATNSWYSSRFVAKPEIHNWSMIGWLCAQTGVLFVERARKRDVHRVMHVIADAMRSGDAICVFPEGMTSDGLQLLPFHANLFQTPVSAGASIRPSALRYRIATTGELMTIPAYIGDLSMTDTTNAMLSGSPLVVEVFVDPAVAPEMDRWALAVHSQEAAVNLITRVGQANRLFLSVRERVLRLFAIRLDRVTSGRRE